MKVISQKTDYDHHTMLAIVVMVCDIVVPKSLEIQWQTDQNDDVPMVSLSAMLRSFHQFLIVLLFSFCCQKLVKLTPEHLSLRFQCLALLFGVTSKGVPRADTGIIKRGG